MFNFPLQVLIFLSLSITVICHDSSESCEDNSSGESFDFVDLNNLLESGRPRHRHRGPRYVCPRGWQYSERIRSPWCIKVFPAVVQPRGIARELAEGSCESEGAVLTGVENEYESDLIQRQSLVILQNASLVSGAIWVGGYRSTGCIGDNATLPQCVPAANNAFEWSDNHTIGKAGFKWALNEPDYLAPDQLFVCMFVIGGYDPTLRPGTTSGSMDDVGRLPYLAPQPFVTARGYACGKRAVLKH